MIKQTRASRWLQVLETGRVMMKQSVNSAEMYRANGKQLPRQAQEMLIRVSADPIRLMTESNPPIAGTALAEQLNGVIQRANSLEAGGGFHAGLLGLVEAVDEILPVLRSTTDDEIDSATTLVAELERGFMLSLILSMSAHNAILQRVSDWEGEHSRFVQGRSLKDVGHYFSMHATNADEIQNQSEHVLPVKSSFYSDTPGPGKIHMQHLIHAINSGANIMVLGGGGMGSTEYYPEAMGIEYAQWFTYIHALWDEQFRPRLAAMYNRGKEPEDKLQKNDIKSMFFNDIRKIRTDFVHHQGTVEDAAHLEFFDWNYEAGSRLEISLEQMIEVMDKFPRDQLLEEPRPQKQKRKSLRGSFDANLLDKYLEHVDGSPTFGINQANDEMMRDWLMKKGLLAAG